METRRLCLTPLAEVHRSDFVALVSDPEVVHWCFDVPPEEQISEQFDARIGKLNGAGSEWNSYAVLNKEDGSFVGMVIPPFLTGAISRARPQWPTSV
ncbi:GNAT family N-acetyltransferase, partial [Marinimicrobium sp. C2-29]|uniref:GNAT family N-acetyltransferase n=1 Tax=Marinimicrobium sp. C2-29 TaxID=3139825 RepID=UPI00313A3650